MALEENSENTPAADDAALLSDSELAIAREEDRSPVAADDAAPTDQLPAGTDASSSEPSAATQSAGGGTDAAGEPTTDEPWYSDDDKELASSYGLSEDDLKGFESEAEFRRAAALFDRQLVAGANSKQAPPASQPPPPAGQATGQATATPPAQPPAGKQLAAAKPPAPPAATPAATAADPDDIDVQKYIDAGYDEDTIRLVKVAKAERDARQALEAKFEELNSGFQQFQQAQFQAAKQQEHARKLNSFHEVVDNLAESRFGRTVDAGGKIVKLDAKLNDNRRKLFEMTETLVDGIVTRAKKVGEEPRIPPYSVLVRRAEQLVFAEELRQEEQQRMRERISKQSSRRRQVASTRQPEAARAQRTVGPAADEAAELASNPQLAKLWNEMHSEVGAGAT